MAIFDDSQKLSDALNELALEGVNFRRLCVVGRPPALASVSLGQGRRRPRIAQVTEPVQDDGMTAALWTAVVGVLFAGRPPAGKSADCVKDVLPTRLFDTLKSYVERGRYVLLVSSRTPLQHDRLSKILLKGSTGRLFTHEFTRRAAESGEKPPGDR